MEKLILGLCLTFLLQLSGCEQLVNIALHKTPTQNGTLEHPVGSFWNVSHSVDGLTECTKPVDGQHYSGTAIEKDPWWQLDLGSIYNIKAMHLLGRPDTALQLGGFQLWAGLDIDDLSMMYKDNEAAYNNGSIWVNNTRIIARIIKIDLPRDNATKRIAPGPLTLCEVKVLILSVDANIKHNSTTSGSGIYRSFRSHLALDGKYQSASETPEECNCCSITTGSGTLWWTIDFGQPRLIGRIYITGRRDIKYQNQSKDLSIFVSSAIPEPSFGRFGDFVWNITSSETGNFFQHTFHSPTLFRYMSITQPGTSTHFMTLCEVDFSAVECQKGHYGTDCIEMCGHCIDGNTTCSVTDGTCSAGCASGYDRNDKTCKTCTPGHFGTGCIETCGHCIDGNTTCTVTDGTCSAGCAPRYDRNDKTCKTCTQGHFGTGCIETCGHCIDGNTACTVTDGTCSDGCAPGYDRNDKTCKTCTPGHFGTGCIETCGHCIDGNTTCTVKDGTCSAGCAQGYKPTDVKCKTVCSPGQYGLNCSEDCGQCINGTTSCLNNDGSCPSECAPGYDPRDITCKKECQPGKYGLNCSETCGHCVEDNNTCNKTDGSCPGGCAAGFNFTADRTCFATCQDGKFGHNCSETCGKCSGGSEQCSKIDGVCRLQCDDGYKGAKCLESQDKKIDVAMIVGAVVSAFIIVLSVVALVVVLKRRGRLPKRRASRINEEAGSEFGNLETMARESDTQRNKAAKTETSDEQNHSRENGGYYSFNPGDHATNSVKIRDLWEYITRNRANSFEDLFVEFQTVPEGFKFEYYAAQRDENVGKNKYRNMYPYDHCRVKLKVPEGQTDYINASHVDGYDRIQKFIAAQGPQKGTIEDFWLMVWQQGVRKVVMLTNVLEMGKDKCEQYWPNEGTSIQYGGIEVTSKETTEKSDYCIRKFELRMEHEKLRRVKQFHFKSWPDKDVPDSTWCLVNFWRVAMNKDHGKPFVVHCSAGIGRTGTFIALDSLYHQAMAEGGIRPVSVIETLRRQRINMVQTKYQYVFLHEAVADALLVGTHFFWASQLPSVCNFFRGRNHEASVTRAQEQFNLICECILPSEEQQQASSSSAAAAENIYEETGEPMAEPEYGNISTLQSEISEYRPKTKDRISASLQQTNAIYLPNYAEASTYILAETPSESSLPEFWSMVEEQNVTTIVNLTENTHPYFQTSCTLGANGGKPVGRFVVNVVKEVKHKEYTIRSIVYKEEDKKESNAGFTVKIFSLSSWQQGADCPSDLDPLMALLEEVNKWHPYVSEAKPMLFICSDGRTRCGLVAAILNESQRMRNEEGHVNIVETVMTMKKRAGDVISAKQFKFLYEAVLAYALRMGYVLDTGDYNNI